MTIHLLETMEGALSKLVREAEAKIEGEASVLVQFAAGDWAKIKAAVIGARAKVNADASAAVTTAAGDMQAAADKLAATAAGSPTPPQNPPAAPQQESTDKGAA